MSKQLSIIANNKQGASTGISGNRRTITSWMQSWNNPEDFSAVVIDPETGETVAEKPFGRKTIKW